MAGTQQHFIAGIRADTDLQYRIDGPTGPRWNNLHLQQSKLDSSCGLLSFLQAAMVLCQIPRAQVERLTSTSRQPLRRLWQLAKDQYFEGTDHREIAAYAQALAPMLSCATVPRIGKTTAGAAVRGTIDAGGIPMLRFDSDSWSHWTTVTGYELADGEVSALLTLDPGASAPWSYFANCRLSLTTSAKDSMRSKPPYTLPYRHLDGEAWAVKPRGLVILQRAQAP